MILLKKITLFFLLFASNSFAQEFFSTVDTSAILRNIVRVSDSLRNQKNYAAAIQQLGKGLEIYRNEKKENLAEFEYSDTLTAQYDMLPTELIYDRPAYRTRYRAFRMNFKVFYRKDSSYFNGYILQQVRPNLITADFYQNSSLILTKEYSLLNSPKKENDPFPFPSMLDYFPAESNWLESIHVHGKSRTYKTLLGNFHKIEYFEDLAFHTITLSDDGDTIEYAASLTVDGIKYNRSLSRDAYSNELFYNEATRSKNEHIGLGLSSKGDTLNFAQYTNGRRNGVHIYCENYGEMHEVYFRLLWKNDTVVDILNTNILYLKENLKPISEVKYLKKNPMNADVGVGLYLESYHMLRKDKNGKIWIVIPYKVKDYSKFIEDLNTSKWQPLYPD